MDTLAVLLVPCQGNPLAIDRFPHKGPVIRTFDVFFVASPNSRVAGVVPDLRCHVAHTTSP